MLHDLILFWFEIVRDWGYWGIFILMAMESSIFPVPSEVVMPPAAYWASQGQMSFEGVVIAGTLGSYFGSAVTYLVAKAYGTPLVQKYGKYFFISPEKIAIVERWVKKNGVVAIFVSRLLPVVRHLISIPAGILKMNFKSFSIVTTLGAGIWCYILSVFGSKVLGDQPELLTSPEAMVAAVKSKLVYFVGAILGFAILYFATKHFILGQKKDHQVA